MLWFWLRRRLWGLFCFVGERASSHGTARPSMSTSPIPADASFDNVAIGTDRASVHLLLFSSNWIGVTGTVATLSMIAFGMKAGIVELQSMRRTVLGRRVAAPGMLVGGSVAACMLIGCWCFPSYQSLPWGRQLCASIFHLSLFCSFGLGLVRTLMRSRYRVHIAGRYIGYTWLTVLIMKYGLDAMCMWRAIGMGTQPMGTLVIICRAGSLSYGFLLLGYSMICVTSAAVVILFTPPRTWNLMMGRV